MVVDAQRALFAIGARTASAARQREPAPCVTRGEQIGVQLLGIVVYGAWTFGLAYLVLRTVDLIFPLRVSADHEIIGLNISEHGVRQEFETLEAVPLNNAETTTK